MKRTPLTRKTPLRGNSQLKRSPLKRSAQLLTRSKLVRKTKLVTKTKLTVKPKPPMPKPERAAAAAWYMATVARGCEVCPGRGEECEGKVQGHHVIEQQQLTKRGLDAQLWNQLNGMGACYKAHRRHTSRLQPIERRLLRREHFEFAEMFGLLDVLDRVYR